MKSLNTHLAAQAPVNYSLGASAAVAGTSITEEDTDLRVDGPVQVRL